MIGEMIGDMHGAQYEFEEYKLKKEEYPLFSSKCEFTDDTVATIAVIDALSKIMQEAGKNKPLNLSEENIEELKKRTIEAFHFYVKAYPHCGWGSHFHQWGMNKDTKPYKSWGNGSAMRISPVGWIADSEEEVKILSKAISEVTHNHAEGIKGAEATAMCIYWARKGVSKEEIKARVIKDYYPIVDMLDYDTLVEEYRFDVSCQGTVPPAIYCFLISNSFEDCLRTCLSIGGDSDTLSAIGCSIAEAFYKPGKEWKEKAYKFLPERFCRAIDYIESWVDDREPIE